MMNKRFSIKSVIIVIIMGVTILHSMPLHPEFVKKLRKEGKLQEVVDAYKKARVEWSINRIQGTPSARVSGSGIAILIDFDDNPADTINHPPASYDSLLFSVGIYPTGSMKDFYIENSYGKFKFTGRVAPDTSQRRWYRSSKTYSYYSENFGFTHSQELVKEAVALADPDVDFGEFDNDGPDGIPNSGDDDGIVDAVYIIHAGPGYEEYGCGGIWSHMSMTSYTTNDPAYNGGNIKIGPYSIQPEEHCNGDLIDVGVFCHEFGHILGMPDLYDYGYDSKGLGKWSLMAGGSWNGNLGSSPAHFDAWCKVKLGWVEPVVVEDYMIGASIPEVESNPVIYKLWTEGEEGPQYFLVENRQRKGFDRYLPGDGLLVYHVDEYMSNNNNQYIPGVSEPGSEHYLVALEQADGRFQLEYNTSSGDVGDPFKYPDRDYIAGLPPYPKTFDYNERNTRVAIFNITQSDSVMYADFDVNMNLPRFYLKEYHTEEASGDNDHQIEPGETSALWVTIGNLWGDMENVEIELTSSDPSIEMTKDKVNLGEMKQNTEKSNIDEPFLFYIDENSTPHRTEFILKIKCDVPDYVKEETLRVITGWTGILLVDDDKGDTVDIIYKNTLDNIGVIYNEIDISQVEDLEDRFNRIGMQDSIIIWFTGSSEETLSPQEISIVKNFLDNGAKLFISSENLGEDIGDTEFYSNYMKSQLIDSFITIPVLTGIEDDPISKGRTVGLRYLKDDSKDLIQPIDGATPVFKYKTIENGYAAIKYEDGYKLVYFAFPFELVQNTVPRYMSGEELMTSILEWFGLELGVKEKPIGDSIPGVVVCRRTGESILFKIDNSEGRRVSLKLYDINGRLVEPLFEGDKKGHFEVKWNTDKIPPGVYFYIFDNSQGTISGKVVVIH